MCETFQSNPPPPPPDAVLTHLAAAGPIGTGSSESQDQKL